MLKPLLQPCLAATYCEYLEKSFSLTFYVAKKQKKSWFGEKTTDFTKGYISVQLWVFKLFSVEIITVFLEMLHSLWLFEITARFDTDV